MRRCSASLAHDIRAILVLAFFGAILAGCGGGSGGSSSAVAAFECVNPVPLSFSQLPVSGPSISGIIEIEANARVDKDTAEIELGQASTPRIERLPSAVILGGYLSAVSGIHEDTPNPLVDFTFPVDAQDRYCIELEAGQRVDVEFFGAEPVSRVRLLRASDGKVVALTDFDANPAKSLEMPADAAEGNYVIDIEVQAPAGPSKYILVTSPTGAALNLDWAPGDFVPGEAVVTLAGGGTGGANTPSQAAALAATSAPLNLERELGNGQYQVSIPASLLAQSHSPEQKKQQTVEWVRQLRELDDVVSASPNYIFQAMAAFEAVNEPLYRDQWHYPLINLPQAWQLAPDGGDGVNVAVLDTGIFRFEGNWHVDLAPNLPDICTVGTCFDFIDDDELPADPGSSLGGSVYHGTHVAGTIAASGFNGEGGTGVAPSARILPARVLDENGSGDLSGVIDAINWAAAVGADVINLSLGSAANPPELATAIDAAVAEGVLVVAAAGNSPDPEKVYPAAYPNVFGVGAVDGAGVLAGYSNTGEWVDLTAPGGDASRDANQDGRADVVVSASGNPDTGFTYAGLQGTSMATPHVAGVFALMKGVVADKAELDTAVVMGLLGSGALTGTMDETRPGYGKGVIDAAKAVQAASSGNLALLSPASPLIEFSEGVSQKTLRLNRVGNSGVTIDSVTVAEDRPWLSAGPAVAVDDGFTVALTIDRSLLESGRAYRAELDVGYRAGGEPFSLTVPITVPVESPIATREAGLHFVLLIDDAMNVVAQTAVVARGGTYDFEFEVVEPGAETLRANQVTAGESYYLVAGTDLDNDGFICTPGEACAEYPIAGLRERVTVVLENGSARMEDSDGQVIEPSELVMTTSFSRPLSAQSLPRPGFEGYKLLESPSGAVPRALAD